ncbi:MAG: T9SS type A sorting domain-containing protein, partial [Bacteroidales bacterium]|nr:T9SS type A sorting domain-containing protein [Bacteroidales bacterium]
LIPYETYGTWQLGRLTVPELISGDYTFAVIDKSHLGAGELPQSEVSFTVTPNPAESQIRIASELDEYDVLIVNALGQTVSTFPVKGKEKIISISDYKSGIYYINFIDRNKNIISTQKLIKR